MVRGTPSRPCCFDTMELMAAHYNARDETNPVFPTLVLIKTRAPPKRRSMVHRSDLIERLSKEDGRRITLVKAPAGYGKTTLLMQWAEADPMRRFAWLTLEKTEDDPVLLWRYLLLAVRTLSPGFADDAWGLLRQAHPSIGEVVAKVLNHSLDLPGRLVLVLDDYHVVESAESHESVQYFIDHLPRSLHVALGTRARPPLRLSRLEAKGQLLTIDTDALRFSLDETRQALYRSGKRLNAEEITEIHETTEGWPAGVHLSMNEGPPSSTGGGAVNTYLREQVLADLPRQELPILATWSILQHLNADLCDAVTGQKDSTTRLQQLSETNMLLIPLDIEGAWYRIHDLLRDELSREFARLPTSQQQVAHLRATEWWLDHDETPQAIDHAIAAGAYDRAGQLIATHWFAYMLNGRLETLRRWIGQLPEKAMLNYPPILVASGWIAGFSGDVEATRRYASAASRAAYDGAMPDGSASFVSAVAIMRAGLGLDGMELANEQAEIAYRIEPPQGEWRPIAAALAGLTRFGLGRFEEARIALEEAMRIPTAEDGVATYARGQLALLEMQMGNWEAGARHAQLACRQIEESNIGNLVSSGAATAAAAAAASHSGNRTEALERLRSLAPIQRVLSDAIPFDAFQIHLVAAETYLLLDDARSAGVHADTASLRLAAFGDAGIFERRLTDVRRALDSANRTANASKIEQELLSERELQVLELLQSDLSLRAIGGKLYISRNTAKSHVASLYRKLGVSTRTAAIARARQLDLI